MVFPHTYRNEHTETITTNYTYGSWYAEHVKFKIPIKRQLLKLLKDIDGCERSYRRDLSDTVAIKCIPTNPKYSKEIYRMKSYVEGWFNKLSIRNESFDIGSIQFGDQTLVLPPVLLGRLKSPIAKITLCVYLHLDVREQNPAEWDSDPWTLSERDAKYYGCGTASSKGPLLCWMHAIQSFNRLNFDLPINIKFIVEFAYTLRSPELMKFLVAKKQDFFNDIEYVVCNLSEWLGQKYPSIVYGTVGVLYMSLMVQKNPETDSDLSEDAKKILDTIVNDENKILIPHFNDYVDQVTPDEERIYESIRNFDIDAVRASLPPHKQHLDKIRLLMDFWRNPSITVGEVMTCACDDPDTSIVRQDFMVKIVPRQIVEKSVTMINAHVKNAVKELDIKSKVDVVLQSSVKHWIEDIYCPLFQAAKRATLQIYKEDPDMIREDKSRLIITILKMVFEKPVLCLPLVSQNCNKYRPNEFIPKKNYMEGTKLIAALIIQLGEK